MLLMFCTSHVKTYQQGQYHTPTLFTRATVVSIFGHAPPALLLSLPTTAELRCRLPAK